MPLFWHLISPRFFQLLKYTNPLVLFGSESPPTHTAFSEIVTAVDALDVDQDLSVVLSVAEHTPDLFKRKLSELFVRDGYDDTVRARYFI